MFFLLRISHIIAFTIIVYMKCINSHQNYVSVIAKKSEQQRPYTVWSNSSKEAFEKEFGDFVRRDFGYPSKCFLWIFDNSQQQVIGSVRY